MTAAAITEGITMPQKIKDREYRSLMPLSAIMEAKRLDSDYYVEGYATTFNDPYLLYEYDGVKVYEVIDRHALDEADLTDVIMQYDHQGKVLARLSNNTLGLIADDKGLLCYADLSKSAAAKDLHEEIKNGLITKMSWGFVVEEDSWNSETHTRTILKIKKVYDVSAVSIPANDGTVISARNFAQGRLAAEQQELLERRKHVLKIKLLMEE